MISMRKKALVITVWLAMVMVVLRAYAVGGAAEEELPTVPSSSSFCGRAEASRTCATPPTVDANFKVEEYLGKWYEIGSTASFKLLTEAGLACNQALYRSSPAGRLSLLNSGLRVISRLAVAEVTAVNLAARGACAAAREVCHQLSPLTHLSRSLSNHSLAYRLASSAQAAELALQRLAEQVSLVQQANGQISQANYSSGGRTLQSSVADIKQHVKEGEQEQGAIAAFASELNKLRGQVKKESEAVAEALGSVALKVGASSAGMEVSLKAVGAGAKALVSNGQPINEASVSSVTGTITQPNATSAGKLEVGINGAKSPYWILALERSSEGGSYSAALVYSCTQAGKSLFVLSREPTLDSATLFTFLAKAESLGIYNDCEDPFLLTLQRGGDCGQPAPSPNPIY